MEFAQKLAGDGTRLDAMAPNREFSCFQVELSRRPSSVDRDGMGNLRKAIRSENHLRR
jgi:hypothetical protein